MVFDHLKNALTVNWKVCEHGYARDAVDCSYSQLHYLLPLTSLVLASDTKHFGIVILCKLSMFLKMKIGLPRSYH